MSESEPKRSEIENKPVRIGLLGATFDTGNMGVSALAESTIKCILHRWPDAEVTLLGGGRVMDERQVKIGNRELRVKELPIRFCRNVFLENHFLVLCLYALMLRIFRLEKFRHFCTGRNASLRCITSMDMFADITGGDSFSDIYGMRRFIQGFLHKWLVLQFNRNMVMLPQTYGPFKRPLARAMAGYILKRAGVIYSRDNADMEYVNTLAGKGTGNNRVRFSPDVAFVLDSRKPKRLDIEPSADMRACNSTIIGLNVSGLLFHGGYNRNNMFGLEVDYRDLLYDVIDAFMKHDKVGVLLVSHVFSPPGTVENDLDACREVYEAVRNKYANRIFMVCGRYDQCEIKYIIGRCDFFIGSRMHACIAAMSQCIPAVGIAYNKKFYGVFDSVGLADCVVDARNFGKKEILEKLEAVFARKEQIHKCLMQTTAHVEEKVLSIFLQ